MALTEEEYDATPKEGRKVHPLCARLRELRHARGLSLNQFEVEHPAIPAVVLGAYERGDRVPPVSKLEEIYKFYGYRLDAVPINANHVRLDADMVADLRAIADQMEQVRGLQTVP